MKTNLINFNTLKLKYDQKLLTEANRYLRQMIQITSSNENSKLNSISRNVFSSIIKRKSGWGTTIIEKVKINEKYLSSIRVDEPTKFFTKDDSIYWKEASNIISLYEKKIKPNSLEEMLKIHFEIFKDTKSFAGKIKTKTNIVEFTPRQQPTQYIEFLEPNLVMSELEKLINFINKFEYDSFVLSALIHAQLVAIHPFEDGNGRFSRVISTLIFEKKENVFLPIDEAIIREPSKDIEHNNEEYRYMLNRMHLDNKVDEWINYILEKYIYQMKINILLVEKINSNYKTYENILESSKIKKKYQINIISMLLSELILTTNKVKVFLGITDRRTCLKILEDLKELKLVKDEGEKNGREVLYKVIELNKTL